MNDLDVRFSGAVELGRMIRDRKVSSTDLAKLYLDSLDSHGRRLNAVAELTRDLAMEQARRADDELRGGAIRSPLHGVPWGAKDLLATKGIPTRWGSPAHADQVFDYDATVVERLRDAGCVLVGKLAMIELAGAGAYDSCAASITGGCRCPYDESRWSGGSSSGSGAAVGAGLVGFAIGSETWGSIMVPAAFCNVTGLRPTYGRVPRHGAMSLAFTMDKLGPMARSAEDCAAILQIISSHDGRDPSSTTRPLDLKSEISDRRLRLGILHHDYDKNEAGDAKRRFDETLNILRKLGHEFEDAKLPEIPYGLAAGTIVDVEGATAFEDLVRSDRRDLLVDDRQKAGLLSGLAIPGVDYLRAMRIRAHAGVEAVRVFERFDALVAPTLLHVAPPIDKPLRESFAKMGGNGAAGNLLGWPSISVPMGLGEHGLPLGLEIIGAPYEESTILSVAIAFQRETDWHRRRGK
jgi:aspartyl-tRNA(Asn)/glutamyl-tRNA(Gln) amidotransferase subunit A